MATFLYLLLTLYISFHDGDAFHRYHDYCVVGAGPAGLQMGYFLKRANRDYIVFERYNTTGQFFAKYPRHRTLISINKRHTGQTNKEFNFRHDWNSLISDDESLLFRHYSKKMYPHADEMLAYLQDYKERLAISVQFNTEISDIRTTPNDTTPDGILHLMDDQHGNTYSCKVLIIASGMWTPFIPDMKGIELAEGYETLSVDPADYEGKSVLILGRGNSGFEVAKEIYGVTSHISMVATSRARLAFATHYVGDLRAVNTALLDTYQLKSLDGLSEQNVTQFVIEKKGYNFILAQDVQNKTVELGRYDAVLRCLGFTFNFSIFRHYNAQGKKYPAIKHNYESQTMKGVFFAGTNTHSLDYRKSAGGFIHGFRYTARVLSRLLSWRFEGEPWPCQQFGITELMSVLLKRINEASGPYQMFQFLGDVIVFSENGDTFDYCEEFPVNLLHEFPQHTGHNASRILVFTFEFGANYSGPGKDVFSLDRASSSPMTAHLSNFIHPVLYYYQSLPTEEQMKKEVPPRPFAIHHILEDFHTDWTLFFQHIEPLNDFLEYITGIIFLSWDAKECFLYGMLNSTIGLSCDRLYMKGGGMALMEMRARKEISASFS